MRSRMIPILALSFLVTLSALAGPFECGTCPGHYVMQQSDYPYSEDILLTNQVLSSTWTTVLTGCVTAKNASHNNVQLNGVNYYSNVATNGQVRGFVGLRGGTPGVRYEVRFVRKAVGSESILETYGWYVRQVKNSGFEQGESFFSAVRNLPAGQHRFEMQARVIDFGHSITLGVRWMAVQGVPSDNLAPGLQSRYPSDSQGQSATYTITGTWSPNVLPTITFRNSEPVDVFPQAYVEVNSGTAGDQVSFGFQLDSEPQSRRVSDIAVPTTFGGFPTREGINIVDHIENVPAGTHTLKLWAVSRTGRPVTVSWRALEFTSFPRDNGTNGLQFTQYPLPPPYVHPSLTVIDSSILPAQSPKGQTGAPYGYWHPVTSEFSFNPDPPLVSSLDWTGGGWIEIRGRSGNWADTRVEMMIETYHWDPNQGKYMITDMMWVPATIPPGRGHIYFFTEAFIWRNQHGNKMRIWFRKVIPTAGATFSIGKVYAAMKLVPTYNGQCFYRSCDPLIPGSCN
ncbi:MAG: hypothetical protein ACXWH7_04730 [Thermoanaerobaculia bacterium]